MPCQCPNGVNEKDKLSILKAERVRLDGEKNGKTTREKSSRIGDNNKRLIGGFLITDGIGRLSELGGETRLLHYRS